MPQLLYIMTTCIVSEVITPPDKSLANTNLHPTHYWCQSITGNPKTEVHCWSCMYWLLLPYTSKAVPSSRQRKPVHPFHTVVIYLLSYTSIISSPWRPAQYFLYGWLFQPLVYKPEEYNYGGGSIGHWRTGHSRPCVVEYIWCMVL